MLRQLQAQVDAERDATGRPPKLTGVRIRLAAYIDSRQNPLNGVGQTVEHKTVC